MTREGYADPTADQAIRNVMREHRQKAQRSTHRHRKGSIRVWRRSVGQ